MAHDALFAGHMAYRATKHRIKYQFYFPLMEKIIQEYCASCEICQKRAPVKVADRVPIAPILRSDELPFNHLDCIGPIIAEGDPSACKPLCTGSR
jgi:ferredoxin